MNVRSLRMSCFMSHVDTVVQLPERGIVVVSGPNGSGKSSLIEAVSVACYGKTLRGSSPWRDEPGLLQLTSDLANVTRERFKAKSKLTWEAADDADRAALRLKGENVFQSDFDTASKAQAALESIIGPWDVWRRTAVFSSQDASHFTQATDAERKRLLESILQLDRFDAALERCRDELRAADGYHEQAQRREQATVIRVEEGKKAKARALVEVAEHGKPVDVAALQKQLDDLAGAVKSCDGDMRGLRAALRDADRVSADARAEAQAFEREAKRLAGGKCPTCGQDAAAVLAGLDKKAKAASKKAATAHEEAVAHIEQLQAEVAALDDETAGLNERQASLRAELQEAKRVDLARTRAQSLLAEVEYELHEWENELESAREGLVSCAQAAAELKACERVLGLRGLRSTVLGRALAGVEAAANAWLARIAGPGLRLKLKSHTEKRTGGISDLISMDVEGVGGGFGYKAMSGGERRRVDIALMLALSEVAAAVVGRVPGTLFFDEVVDALDLAGREAVAVALGVLAEQRCVVVITHSPDLLDALSPVQRLVVDSGLVSCA